MSKNNNYMSTLSNIHEATKGIASSAATARNLIPENVSALSSIAKAYKPFEVSNCPLCGNVWIESRKFGEGLSESPLLSTISKDTVANAEVQQHIGKKLKRTVSPFWPVPLPRCWLFLCRNGCSISGGHMCMPEDNAFAQLVPHNEGIQ